MLQTKLKEFEKIKATAQADVDIAKAEAKIRLLKREIRSLSTKEARVELQELGLIATDVAEKLGGGAGSVGGMGGGGGGSGKSVARGFFGAAGALGFFTAAATAALPAIVSLGGAVSALIGSLGAAAGGAGALGIGGIGGLAVGIGGIIGIAKPAMTAMKEVKKSQDDYNKAVKQYGDASAQAIKAHRNLMAEYKKNPGAGSVINNASRFGNDFKKRTTAGRGDFFGMLNDSLETGVKLLPTFANLANRSMKAAREGVRSFLQPFASKEWRTIFDSLETTFETMARSGGRVFANLALWFGRISRAAGPYVVRAFEALDRWTGNLASRAGNLTGVQQTIGKLVDQLGDWVKLFGASGNLLMAFFGAGASQGQSMVEKITDQFNEWADWMRDNPDKMQEFFARTIEGATKLADALADVAGALFKISMALIPVLNLVSDLTSALGSGGLTNLALLASSGLVVGKMGGFGRRGPGGGGGGGAAGPVVAGMGGTKGDLRRGGTGRMRGLARGAGWTALALGAGSALTTEGGPLQRAQGALSSMTLGLINAPVPDSALRAQGQQAADAIGSSAGARRRIAALERQLGGANHSAWAKIALGGDGKFLGIGKGWKISDEDKKKMQAELRRLRLTLPVRIKAEREGRLGRSRAHGQDAFADLVGAFDTRSGGKGGQANAFTQFTQGVLEKMKGMGSGGKRVLAESAIQWAQQMAKENPKLKKPMQGLVRDIKESYRSMGDHISVVNGRILTGSRGEWRKIRKALSSETEKARQEVSASFTDIQRQAIGSLTAMGYTKAEANKLVRGSDGSGAPNTGNSTPRVGVSAPALLSNANALVNPVGSGGPLRARGGRVPGVGRADYVALGGGAVGAPGELVVNGHTESKIDQRLGFPGALDMMVRNEKLPHGMYSGSSKRAAYGGRFARGGKTGGLGHPGNIVALGHALQRMGYSVGENPAFGGVHPVHVANSWHYKGLALDVNADGWPGGEAKGLDRLYSMLKGLPGVIELLWRVPNHFDHLHVAMSGHGAPTGIMGGGGGAADAAVEHMKSLKGPKSKLRGVPGAMSDKLSKKMASALTRKVNKRIDAMGGATGGDGGGGGGVVPGIMGIARRAAKIAGVPFDANIVRVLLQKESGGGQNLGAHNYGGILDPAGPFQVISSTFNSYAAKGHGNRMNPFDNALAAFRYIKSRYHTLQNLAATTGLMGSGYHGYAKGGRIPFGGWYSAGGSFTANRPTLIGVGEGGGRERVTVKPESAAGGRGTGGSITVHIGTLVNNQEGDVARILKRELAKVAAELNLGEDSLN